MVEQVVNQLECQWFDPLVISVLGQDIENQIALNGYSISVTLSVLQV